MIWFETADSELQIRKMMQIVDLKKRYLNYNFIYLFIFERFFRMLIENGIVHLILN